MERWVCIVLLFRWMAERTITSHSYFITFFLYVVHNSVFFKINFIVSTVNLSIATLVAYIAYMLSRVIKYYK